MEQIFQWLNQDFGDHLQLAYKYISAHYKTLAKEVLIQNAKLGIKEECAMSVILMLLMEKYMEGQDLFNVKYVLILEFKFFIHLV